MPKKGPYRNRAAPTLRPRTKLKQWRLHRVMTIEELADKSGVSTGSISAVERGSQGLSDDSRDALANALKITPGMLLDVDPSDDAPLWDMIARATPNERQQIAEHAKVIVKRTK